MSSRSAPPGALAPPPCGRFAPSPTGPLHFGSLVAALASFLDARAAGGRWLVRVEDIDTPRVVPGAADEIVRTLDAFALHWDGPVRYQSRCGTHYAEALARLERAGMVYGCSCSRRDLAAAGGAPYPGHCRRGPVRTDRPLALRLRTDSPPIVFHDRIQGPVRQCLATSVGDFVIRRRDGLFAYQLAVVVDDAHQGVTDVVRGADLLECTPRQILLQRLLSLPTPRYAHLPVAVDARGHKLSKQTHAPALDRRRPGPALARALGFLGHLLPAELERAPPAHILDWAMAHWAIARVPTRGPNRGTAIDFDALPVKNGKTLL